MGRAWSKGQQFNQFDFRHNKKKIAKNSRRQEKQRRKALWKKPRLCGLYGDWPVDVG